MEQKANILLVDDSPSKLLAMSAALAELNQCVVTAESGREALRQIAKCEFAVILLDINMPDMDGFETAALIRARKHSAHVPIIFITSYGDDAHASQGYSLGAVDYLLAPIVPEVLRAKVAVFVELHQKTKQIQAQAEERIAFAQEHAARRTAEAANRIKDEFLAVLSHELRTPLNAVLGWVQLLRMGKRDAASVSEGLDVIERNAQLQARIIEDLLDISRIISGKLQLDLRIASVLDCVEGAVHAALPQAEQKQISIKCEFDASLPPALLDQARLQQVIANLLSNAIKFSPPGSELRVVAKLAENEIELSVIDSGEGIAPEFLPYVFERFRQADASTTRRSGGLGIGLAIVRQLIELHGGRIDVHSEGAGKGARFSAYLPAAPVSFECRVQPAESGEEQRSLAGVRILVVEDQSDSRALIQEVFRSCQAEVAAAPSARQGLTMIDAFRPNLIVSDIGMPDMDGYEFIRQIRLRFNSRQLPAIALTAYARQEERDKALLAGFQKHVAKPVSAAELISAAGLLAGTAANARGRLAESPAVSSRK